MTATQTAILIWKNVPLANVVPTQPRRAPTRRGPTHRAPTRRNGLWVFTWGNARNTHSQKMAFMGLEVCALALFLLLGAAAEDERKPNIIFMLMDDVS